MKRTACYRIPEKEPDTTQDKTLKKALCHQVCWKNKYVNFFSSVVGRTTAARKVIGSTSVLESSEISTKLNIQRHFISTRSETDSLCKVFSFAEIRRSTGFSGGYKRKPDLCDTDSSVGPGKKEYNLYLFYMNTQLFPYHFLFPHNRKALGYVLSFAGILPSPAE